MKNAFIKNHVFTQACLATLVHHQKGISPTDELWSYSLYGGVSCRGAVPCLCWPLFPILEKLAPNLPNGAFSWGHQSVRFAQFCGVIQLDDLTLEILPKIHGKEEHPESCRAALVQMLYTARIMRTHKGAQASIPTNIVCWIFLFSTFAMIYIHRSFKASYEIT